MSGGKTRLTNISNDTEASWLACCHGEALQRACTNPPRPPPTTTHNTHLISRGDVLMTHLSSHFIDVGPSVGTVALKKKATIWLAHQGEFALIYLECVEISFPPPCCHEPGESWAATVTDICNAGRGGRLSCFRFLVLEEAGGGGASREGPGSKWVKIAPLAGAPAPLAKLSQRRSVSSWVVQPFVKALRTCGFPHPRRERTQTAGPDECSPLLGELLKSHKCVRPWGYNRRGRIGRGRKNKKNKWMNK